MRRKLRVLALLLLFLLTVISPVYLRNVVLGISTPVVEVTPNAVSEKADYRIGFTISKDLYVGDVITIIFPSDTKIPCSSCNPWIEKTNLKVNDFVCTVDGKGNTAEGTVEIYTPISIKADSNVTVFISRNSGIRNPSTEGEYSLKVMTGREHDPIISMPYKIGKSSISRPKLELDNYLAGKEASYTITFNSGPVYKLVKGVDTISLSFPEGTEVPNVIKSGYILVNGKSSLEVIGYTFGRKVEFVVPEDITPASEVKVEFLLQAGIKNPKKTGTYKLFAWTNMDPFAVESFPYTIIDSAAVSTSLVIDPPAPDGENGWYKSSPVVSLVAHSAVEDKVNTYYKIDEGNFSEYLSPITLPEGHHLLSYYSELTQYSLVELVKSKEFKVDATPPLLTVTEPQSDITVSKTNFVLRGNVQDSNSVRLFVNDKQGALSNNGDFVFETHLVVGENLFNISAIDEAGNLVKIERKVVLSTVVPKITALGPANWQQIVEPTVLVSGKVDVPSDVTINGEAVEVDDTGYFKSELDLGNLSGGIFTIKIVATSKESGLKSERFISIIYSLKPKETVVKLSIDSEIALVGEQAITLDSPPIIKNGRTLVPIRAIVEALGGSIAWHETERKVTITLKDRTIELWIGKPQAKANGVLKWIDETNHKVMPEIINGRAMLPLRFISEALGAKVDWDNATKTITIIYPVP